MDFSHAERRQLFLRKNDNRPKSPPSEVARTEGKFDKNILSKKKFEVST